MNTVDFSTGGISSDALLLSAIEIYVFFCFDCHFNSEPFFEVLITIFVISVM